MSRAVQWKDNTRLCSVCSTGGFVSHFVSLQSVLMRPERDCAQVYPVSEIKQSSRDLLGVCEISHSDAGRQARTLTQVVQMKLWNSFEDKSCWGCSCPGPWGGMLQPLFSHNFPLSTGSSCSVIYQQTLYCFSIYLFTEEETKNPDVDTIVIPLSL